MYNSIGALIKKLTVLIFLFLGIMLDTIFDSFKSSLSNFLGKT